MPNPQSAPAPLPDAEAAAAATVPHRLEAVATDHTTESAQPLYAGDHTRPERAGHRAATTTEAQVTPLPQLALMERRATIASHVLVAVALAVVMVEGLLAGLLCICIGFLATRWLTSHMQSGLRLPRHWAFVLAALIVALAPIALLAFAVPHARELVLDAPTQYRELLAFLAQTVLELRDKVPPEIAVQLPEGAADIQHVIATYLGSKAGQLAATGKTWFLGLVLAFIGLLIGVLAANRTIKPRGGPLRTALAERITHFGHIFSQIMVAQFWIALFNTSLTAIFLLVVMPLWVKPLPYTTALLMLTFFASLIPLVGNIVCNTVLTLVGLSVSFSVAIACLIFLMAIHKTEYFVNAKVIGRRTHMGAWELLTVMFLLEAIFGAAGLIAAPLFYAYAKLELESAGWV